MNIFGTNNVSTINPYSPQSAPNAAYTNKSVQPTNVYSSDSVSILARSAAQTAIFVSGGVTGYKYHDEIAGVGKNFGNAIKSGSANEIMDSVTNGTKTMFTTTASAAGIGALISGGTSLISNTLSFAQGRTDTANATANVATDTIKGAVSGIGGALGGGLTHIGMGIIGFTGTPLVVASVIGGAVGAALLGSTINTDSLRYKIRNAIG
ncbi:MAG: hypothetical protein U0354_11115 [Candidatus Sericytochromatia bacterium]